MIGPKMLAGAAARTAHDKGPEFLFDQVGMGHRFMVYIDDSDYNLGTWTKVGGLSVDWTVHNYRSGESNQPYYLPGTQKYGTISLSRAACSESAKVKRWLEEVTKELRPLSGVIMMLDFMTVPVLTWHLWSFYPIGWAISDFDAGSTRTCIETLKLAHEGFLDDRVKSGQ